MIVDKQPLPDDPTPSEAPPSYDTLESTPSSSSYPIEKQATTKKVTKWFTFRSSRPAKQVRSTVLNLISDIVKHHDPASPISEILASCADACHTYNLSFNSLLQELSLSGHTPMYWAIVKRPPSTHSPIPPLLTALLDYLDPPLLPPTRTDLRLACLLSSDQALFTLLRQSPLFALPSPADALLLGHPGAHPDLVSVTDALADDAAFVVLFHFPSFQRRMKVAKRVRVEFIAKARMWSLTFTNVSSGDPVTLQHPHIKPGTWVVKLALLDHSPPTWLDSRLLIPEYVPSSPPFSPSSPSPSTASNNPKQKSKSKSKPTISLRLKSSSELKARAPTDTDDDDEDPANANAPPGMYKDSSGRLHPRAESELLTPLDDSLMGASLQYEGSSYYSPDGTLHVRFEARLAKPEMECVVC